MASFDKTGRKSDVGGARLTILMPHLLFRQESPEGGERVGVRAHETEEVCIRQHINSETNSSEGCCIRAEPRPAPPYKWTLGGNSSRLLSSYWSLDIFLGTALMCSTGSNPETWLCRVQ